MGEESKPRKLTKKETLKRIDNIAILSHKAGDMSWDELQRIKDANLERIVQDERVCQRKETMREFGTAFVEMQRSQFAAVVDGERKRKENQEIVDGVVSKLTPSIKQAVRDAKKGRSDKGGNHKKREYKNGWRTQKDVADDFNKVRFAPEKGANPKGGCTLSKIKQWDTRYPDATHAHPHCGYHAMLRTNPDLKSAYYEAVSAWRDYWAGWRVAFREWRKAHKASPITAFRYNPVKMVSGYSPDLIGTDADGNQYGTPDGKPKKRKP